MYYIEKYFGFIITMSSKNEKKEDETKDGDNKKDEQKPEEGNEEEEEEDELILEEFGGIEDILEKFSLSMKEVSGVIIVNSDGITVKSTIDKQLTMQVPRDDSVYRSHL